MPITPESALFEQQLLKMMHTGQLSDSSFNELAIKIFGFQYSHNSPYQNHSKALDLSPKNISHWHEIPTVSTDVFKVAQHPLITFPPAQAQHIFLTSGTTGDVRGKHMFPSLALYETAILTMWKSLEPPQPATLVFLIPRPEDAPNSSLSHMMGVLANYYAEAEIIWAIEKDGRMNIEKLAPLAEATQPVAMLGTAIAFLHLFENITLPLPSGSFAMETGGYKGTQRQLEKAELYTLFEKHLTLPESSIINEYSMTELSSQFYTRGLNGTHAAPPWVRTRVIDPRTGTDAPSGQPGHLAIYDLANLHSVMALQTQDIAIAGENGSFTLLGRDPTALPRGCSRAADHALR